MDSTAVNCLCDVVLGDVGLVRLEVPCPGQAHSAPGPGLGIVPGAVLILAGAALALTTVGFFILEGRGTPAVFDPPKRFVPHGPYRLVRNPMYIGGISVLFGWGLYLTSVSMALFAGVAFLIVHTFVVFAEEPGLRKRFGKEYEDYCQTVPRWIPRLTHPPLPK